MNLQSTAEDIVKKYAEQNAEQFNAHNAALVAIDPKTGEILTMVGSKDYFDIAHEGNFNIALAKRQPGSAFKPFVYAAGLEDGYTQDTVLFDVPTQFSTRCDTEGKPLYASYTEKDCYMPENYDHVYRGPMSIRNAIAQSVNVPAVKMLYLVGLDHAIDIAERLGITTLKNKERYGLTLVLGGGEVSLLEMTSAYGVFANDGKRAPYTGILRIEDAYGSVLLSSATSTPQAIDPEIARKMSDMLSDNVARTPAFGESSFLNFPEHHVAVKTGTTNDYRDAWIVGYTPSLVVGAWAGNNDNSAMEKKVAGFIVAPMWNAFFTSAFDSIPNETFPAPQPIPQTLKPALRGLWYGGDTYKVDRMSGMLATNFTPEELIEERVIPNPHEILYWVDKNNPTGPAPKNPYEDSQFLLWEIPTQKWISAHGLPAKAWASVPSGFDDVHKPSAQPIVHIMSPGATSTYRIDEKIVVELSLATTYQIDRIDYLVNNTYLGSSREAPYVFSFVPSAVGDGKNINELRVILYDIVGNKSEDIVHLNLTTAGPTTF